MNPAPEMAPSAHNQPTPTPEPNPVAVAVALGKQPETATPTPPDEAGPSSKPQPVSKKLEDYPDDQLLMVKSNSFSATHSDLGELKNKLVEAGMTFKVASTDVAWWHRIGESGKPTRSWAACFSDPAKQTNFLDMARALTIELANFNIVVEKWDSSKIGGKRGGSKGKQGRVTRLRGQARPTHGLPLKTRRAQSRIRLRACRLLYKRPGVAAPWITCSTCQNIRRSEGLLLRYIHREIYLIFAILLIKMLAFRAFTVFIYPIYCIY
jgi:hypothetical protein